MQDTAIVRASDDFYPREEASSHPHIAACAYNSLFLSPLFQPDWDMFQSKHPAAHLHACARAISGGAVYVSDKVGKHDRQILQQLVLRDGSVLRALRPGLPTEDCIFCDPLRDGDTVLKVHFCGCFAGVPLLRGQVLRAKSGC
jgi:raffinose synthase